jgi:hypothetical protein
VSQAQHVHKILLVVNVDDFEERSGLELVLGRLFDPLAELVRVLLKSQLTQMRPAIIRAFGILSRPYVSILIQENQFSIDSVCVPLLLLVDLVLSQLLYLTEGLVDRDNQVCGLIWFVV